MAQHLYVTGHIELASIPEPQFGDFRRVGDPMPATEKEAAEAVASRIIALLEPPLDDAQRDMIFDLLRDRFCLRCGVGLQPDDLGLHCDME